MVDFKRTAIAVTAVLALWAVPVCADPIVGSDGREPSLAPLLKDVTPAVVNIAVSGSSKTGNPLYDDPAFRQFFDLPEMQQEVQAAGSGVIVDAKRGYLLTNNHVVANADSIIVTLKDNRKLKAKLIGTDPGTDIAVLQIEAENLTALPLGDSDKLEVGDYVIAIGNPFGLGQTVTSGIVSALGRMGLGIEQYESFIQTDASINPGNSGGPLVNLRGELIGINAAILSQSGGNVGIGFAVPISIARSVMDQLVEHGEVRRGWLGVSIRDLTPELAEALKAGTSDGVVIVSVDSSSPADRAGLKVQDVVTAVDGRRVSSSDDLRNRIGFAKIGDTLALTVMRNGTEGTVDVPIERDTRRVVNTSG